MKTTANDVFDRFQTALGVKKDIEVARIFEMSSGSLSNKRRLNSIPYAECVVLHLDKGISLEWLLTGMGDMLSGGGKHVPVYDIAASAGSGSLVSAEEVTHLVTFSDDYLRTLGVTPKNAAIIDIIGDSMSGTYESGDKVLIDMGVSSLVCDGVYIFRIDTDIFVKRIQKNIDGTIEVISDNPAYDNYRITKGSDIQLQILAKVVIHFSRV